MSRLETTILRKLLQNEEFVRKVIPFLKDEYFESPIERNIFHNISVFITKYNALPSIDTLRIIIAKEKLEDQQIKDIQEYLKLLENKDDSVIDWLLDSTEKFCQEKAIYNALMESIEIQNGDSKNKDKGSIPKILSDALAVSFDPNVGHDYLLDSDKRYDFYHKVENRFRFDLAYFNKITKGGLPRKTLNILMAGTGVGKTLTMCHMAAGAMVMGYNPLYITLEMAAERIAERIDANLLDVSLDLLKDLPKDIYDKRIKKLREKTLGRLFIKEYPTASAHVGHFRHLLNELLLKKSYKPDIVFVDYINICSSSRMKLGNAINTYSFIKAVAEELRGLAVEFNVALFSATQTNRVGFSSSDPELTDTSESFGLPATADFMVALVSNEELDRLNQMMIKQLKNRYADTVADRKFLVGVDRTKMRLYDIEQGGQDLNQDAEPPKEEVKKKKDFSKFKFYDKEDGI
jgi:replicative DNA helicase